MDERLTGLPTSVGGVLTGRGADIVTIDDPLKPEEALSQAQRQAANGWYDHTLYSRLNDKLAGVIVLIMHRLHEDDHAQTAIIENGFMHVPERAPWLAQYLHELTAFPDGKHDDQVDSTAQALDWFKGAAREPAGFYGYYGLNDNDPPPTAGRLAR